MCCCVFSVWPGPVRDTVNQLQSRRVRCVSQPTDEMKHPFLQHRSHILVCDRVKWRHTEFIYSILEGQRIKHTLKLLPAYSPHLNAIEYCFHIWKAEVKKTDQTASAAPPLSTQIEKAAVSITDRVVEAAWSMYTNIMSFVWKGSHWRILLRFSKGSRHSCQPNFSRFSLCFLFLSQLKKKKH